MPDSPAIRGPILEAVLEATLNGLGGETLDGSGFEGEMPDDLDAEQTEAVQS
jgi:hypothetical protein